MMHVYHSKRILGFSLLAALFAATFGNAGCESLRYEGPQERANRIQSKRISELYAERNSLIEELLRASTIKLDGLDESLSSIPHTIEIENEVRRSISKLNRNYDEKSSVFIEFKSKMVRKREHLLTIHAQQIIQDAKALPADTRSLYAFRESVGYGTNSWSSQYHTVHKELDAILAYKYNEIKRAEANARYNSNRRATEAFAELLNSGSKIEANLRQGYIDQGLCPDCGGNRKRPIMKNVDCTSCVNGRDSYSIDGLCSWCNGKSTLLKKVGSVECGTCGGTGKYRK